MTGVSFQLTHQEEIHCPADERAYRRVWAMPSGETFSIPFIRNLVLKYAMKSTLSLDPFARNSMIATLRNDLHPGTGATYHLDALVFLERTRQDGVKPDLVLFDPPFSPRQIKELYQSIGLTMTQQDGHRTHSWARERDIIMEILVPGGYVLSCGWDSMGMGIRRGFEFVEGLLVCHGAGHNDTICTVERKRVET